MSQQGRGKYLAFVAHEIKNPLATALWSADLLQRLSGEERAGERADKMIEVSLRALRRMRRLIDDFFTLERLCEGGYQLRRDLLNVGDLVAAVVQQMGKDGAATEGFAVGPLQGKVAGDADMLKRALKCLLEHMGSGVEKPRLTISSPSAAELHIAAENPPSPVVPPPPEDRPTGDPQGAVLGYALAARILDVHGGRIEERDGGLSVLWKA
jgi:nitrogen fixation/metabolism regulation signal transduction histidine kinase